jgi:hypothetical protein
MLRKIKGIISTISEWKKDLDYLVYADQSVRFFDGKRPFPYVVYAVGVIAGMIWSKLMEWTVCRKLSHDWVNTGHAGPDSGTDGGYCKRCGWGFFVRMY